MKGGYLIIDLGNTNFTLGQGVTVNGIYERLESTRKPIRLTNLSIGGKELRDIELVNIGLQGTDYVSVLVIGQLNYSISISNIDVVTITENT